MAAWQEACKQLDTILQQKHIDYIKLAKWLADLQDILVLEGEWYVFLSGVLEQIDKQARRKAYNDLFRFLSTQAGKDPRKIEIVDAKYTIINDALTIRR